jgi:hypothetical protein
LFKFRRGHFDESNKSKVRIDPKGELGIRSAAVDQLITYIYTGKMEILHHHHIIDLIRCVAYPVVGYSLECSDTIAGSMSLSKFLT